MSVSRMPCVQDLGIHFGEGLSDLRWQGGGFRQGSVSPPRTGDRQGLAGADAGNFQVGRPGGVGAGAARHNPAAHNLHFK